MIIYYFWLLPFGLLLVLTLAYILVRRRITRLIEFKLYIVDNSTLLRAFAALDKLNSEIFIEYFKTLPVEVTEIVRQLIDKPCKVKLIINNSWPLSRLTEILRDTKGFTVDIADDDLKLSDSSLPIQSILAGAPYYLTNDLAQTDRFKRYRFQYYRRGMQKSPYDSFLCLPIYNRADREPVGYLEIYAVGKNAFDTSTDIIPLSVLSSNLGEIYVKLFYDVLNLKTPRSF